MRADYVRKDTGSPGRVDVGAVEMEGAGGRARQVQGRPARELDRALDRHIRGPGGRLVDDERRGSADRQVIGRRRGGVAVADQMTWEVVARDEDLRAR